MIWTPGDTIAAALLILAAVILLAAIRYLPPWAPARPRHRAPERRLADIVIRDTGAGPDEATIFLPQSGDFWGDDAQDMHAGAAWWLLLSVRSTVRAAAGRWLSDNDDGGSRDASGQRDHVRELRQADRTERRPVDSHGEPVGAVRAVRQPGQVSGPWPPAPVPAACSPSMLPVATEPVDPLVPPAWLFGIRQEPRPAQPAPELTAWPDGWAGPGPRRYWADPDPLPDETRLDLPVFRDDDAAWLVDLVMPHYVALAAQPHRPVAA